jgi:hypothetical protein
VQHDPDRNGDKPEPNHGTTTATENISHPLWPRLPDGVRVHEDVDFTADDPAAVDYTVNAGHAKNARRRCVATRLDGQRCASRAMHALLVCALHAGRMTPEQGHTAKRMRAQERERHAEQVLQLQRLGTRAVVAETLVEEAANVRLAVKLLCGGLG